MFPSSPSALGRYTLADSGQPKILDFGLALLLGDRVRVSVPLISARADETLWADRYDRALEDVLGLISELADDDMGWSPEPCDSHTVTGGAGDGGSHRGTNPREHRRPAQCSLPGGRDHSLTMSGG